MPFSGMATMLSEDQIARELPTVPKWRREGREIIRVITFPTYLAGAAFVNDAARIAEEANHHPDILLGWRKVTVRLSTHSKGGLTENDFDLARKLDALCP